MATDTGLYGYTMMQPHREVYLMPSPRGSRDVSARGASCARMLPVSAPSLLPHIWRCVPRSVALRVQVSELRALHDFLETVGAPASPRAGWQAEPAAGAAVGFRFFHCGA